MPIRKALAVWHGNLKDGQGDISVNSGNFRAPYSFGSRFKENAGTNPEELIGAAHAGCFSMALANDLVETGHNPEKIKTEAQVKLEKTEVGYSIKSIELATEASVPKIDKDEFVKIAEKAKNNCPVSRALTGLKINLHTRLLIPEEKQ